LLQFLPDGRSAPLKGGCRDRYSQRDGKILFLSFRPNVRDKGISRSQVRNKTSSDAPDDPQILGVVRPSREPDYDTIDGRQVMARAQAVA
jgi:hypothetical protein